jgi:hypothetical protein
MGFNDAKKILSGLFILSILGFLYFFALEPIFFKKTEEMIDPSLTIPDIMVDGAFFDKIESLKNNTVTLDENSIVKNNPFSK